MMEDWQLFAFSRTETNITKIEVGAFEMYFDSRVDEEYFFFSLNSEPLHHEKPVSLCEEKQAPHNW